jgi:hypothetical protein
MRTCLLIGLVVVGSALGLAGTSRASTAAGVRPLEPDEAGARKVGLCDLRCSFQTIPCPLTTSPTNWCTWPPGFNNTRSRCLGANSLGGCYACSASVNKRICVSFPAVNCTPNGSANQTCGFQKQANCTWTGTACVCPGLPARFSGTGCRARDCSSP